MLHGPRDRKIEKSGLTHHPLDPRRLNGIRQKQRPTGSQILLAKRQAIAGGS